MNITLSLLPDKLAICRLPPDTGIPKWASGGGILSITRTNDELSIVCAEADVPEEVRSDRGWRCLQVAGPLDLALTGVLASLANPLAAARINIFAVSTFDTDYLLVKEENLARSIDVLIRSGHRVNGIE
ncbi:MAG TPA: ACT domain-containing protein [Candidatus Desulfaltia sp.]|nr:ACT domain-containing protein [Candidatus Desulfaltia sp.]